MTAARKPKTQPATELTVVTADPRDAESDPVDVTQDDAPELPRGCGCGCNETCNGKSLFRPGHDARLVSRAAKFTVLGEWRDEVPQWVKDIDERDDIQFRIDQLSSGFSIRFSDALAAKYHDAAMALWTKTVNAQTKPAADAEATP